MARRIHTKSRAGCFECKRRHLKCDEARPICRKCAFSKRDCVYSIQTSSRQSPRAGSESTPLQDKQHLSPPDRCHTDASSASPYGGLTPLHVEVNVDHIELFHHFVTETCKTVAMTDSQIDLYRRIMIERSFSEHFLLDQVLALSACHMSLKRPEKAIFYRDIAATRQTSALTGYQDILQRIDCFNCLDVLLFSHLLALHVFFEIFNPGEKDFGIFLDRLVGCIRLLRGINLVIKTWWTTIVQSDLGPLVLLSDEQQMKPKESQQECSCLRRMLDEADLSSASIETCKESLNRLQTYFDSENMLATPSSSTHQLFAWLITASEGYSNLLDQRRPEALVLLAYFSVLLNRRSKSWVIGDAGRRLLMHIDQYLGKSWAQWLEWPKSVVLETVFSPP